MVASVVGESRLSRRARPHLVAYLTLILTKLWLVDGQRLTAYGSLTIDDNWFIRRAAAISTGDWLGPFEYRTLIKQPGYPLFIAAAHFTRIPLLHAEHLFYAAAAAMVIVALRPLLPSRRRRVIAFALLLFNPMTMNTPISARVDRAGIYPAMVMLLLACLVGLVVSSGRPDRFTPAWAFGASVSLGCVWWLREEWLLVLPAVVVALVLAIGRVGRWPLPPLRRLAMIVVIALVPVSVVMSSLALERLNESHYGLAITNIEQTSMSAGIGPMFRVAPFTAIDRYPITAETRVRLYAASPTLASLRNQIERRTDQRYFSTRPDGVRDFDGQVFQWVVLDAIGAAGLATTATQLDQTFRAIGSEIDAACSAERLRCGDAHDGIAPAWQWSRTPSLALRTLRGLRKTIDLNAFSAISPAGDGTAAERAMFTDMTSESLAPGPSSALTRLRVHLISALRLLYKLLIGIAIIVAMIRTRSAVRHRSKPSWPMLAVVTLGSLLVLGRTVGLAYLDLTAFPGFSPTYLATGYAAALVVAAAVLLGRNPPAVLVTEVPIAAPSPAAQ